MTNPTAVPMVGIENVDMRYGGAEGTLAVSGLTMSVNKGQFAAVVGPSGCGKSTLMKLVTGLYIPSNGHRQRCRRAGERTGLDGRHGVSEPDHAALADDARQHPAAA
jgi:ABC-type nitrate/sulfonate/bicarbonate transport system ATPase subunit